METLYVKEGCPFCVVVLKRIDELGIKVTLKDIADEAFLAELIEKGGKKQVPYLFDEECGVSMYESIDISIYLANKYGQEAFETQDKVCPVE